MSPAVFQMQRSSQTAFLEMFSKCKPGSLVFVFLRILFSKILPTQDFSENINA